MIEVKNLKKYYHSSKKTLPVKAVDDVTFSIQEGKTFGLVGESGCGKTTLARTIVRLVEPTSGSVVIDGTDVLNLDKAQMRQYRKNVQMVFQDPYASLHPRMTVQEIIQDPLKIFKIGTQEEQKDRVSYLLETVGLDRRYATRYPHEFSGGQRQRIGIARALALNPKFIILDEAVSALDVSVQAQIINLLNDLQEQFDLTYLFIAHDLSVVRYMCDNVGVMYLGKLMEVGTNEDIFNNPSHPYTKTLLASNPSILNKSTEYVIPQKHVDVTPRTVTGCPFYPRCQFSMEKCRDTMPEKVNLTDEHIIYCHLYTDR